MPFRFDIRKIFLLISLWTLVANPSWAAQTTKRLIAQAPPAPPTFNLATGVYRYAIDTPNLIISAPSGTTIYYSIDGSQPTNTSLNYWQGTTGFSVTSPTQVNAVAIDGSGNTSSVATVYLCVDADAINIPSANQLLWLRGDLGISSTAGALSQWVDLSGSSNNASQTVAGNKPTYVDEARNGQSAVNFSGGQFLQMPTGFANFSNGASFILVVSPSNSVTGSTLIDIGNGAASDNLGVSETSTSGGAQLYAYNGATSSSVNGASALNTKRFQVLTGIYDYVHNTATLYTNGVQQAQNVSMQTVNNIPRANNCLGRSGGGGNYFQGQIAEVLLYNSALTTSQQAAVESYLIGKYQVLTQSVAAPVISVPTSTLTGPTQVAIAAEGDAQIFWTSDGTTPSTSSNSYSGPLNIFYSQTIKSIAVSDGQTSAVSSSSYTLDPSQWPAPSTGGPTLQLKITLPTTSIPQ